MGGVERVESGKKWPLAVLFSDVLSKLRRL